MGITKSLKDLYHENTNYQIIPRSWRWLAISGTLLFLSVGSFFINGLNTSIEFKGGTSFEVEVVGKSPSVQDVRELLADINIDEPKIQILDGKTVKVTARHLNQTEQGIVLTELSKYAGTDKLDITISDVGPSWGKQVTKKSFQAMIVFFVIVATYMAFRFEWAMALAAVASVLHDVIITVGIYSIFGFNVSPATVVAFLTILGFSLYDTVVVFDKIKENTRTWEKLKPTTYSEMVNRSLNQVLARSINTSVVAVLPVLSLIVVGTYGLHATALLDFALALATGLAIGAYSSIFVATPLLVAIKRWTKRDDNMYV